MITDSTNFMVCKIHTNRQRAAITKSLANEQSRDIRLSQPLCPNMISDPNPNPYPNRYPEHPNPNPISNPSPTEK